ncbi:acyl-CoA synthetase short-chain family member 3, mitochondrial [Cloeon dipterum]|uniref:acyl-CoA synthetase short-chain family member 3, mitochondrial n=1 Tax=Cloeon dipterum TaxID=197152 RepID=UPI00321F9EA2
MSDGVVLQQGEGVEQVDQNFQLRRSASWGVPPENPEEADIPSDDEDIIEAREKRLANKPANSSKGQLDLYKEVMRRSLQEPEKFWAQVASEIYWNKPWDKVLDNSKVPFTHWFSGGELNVCYNAVDRHVLAGRGDKVALIHDSPVTNSLRHVTYRELQQQVSLLAGALLNLDVVKGDRVLIYMPMIPEAIIAMLASARIGAIHSVVFGGFAARELCARLEHCRPKVVILANCGVEPSRVVPYRAILHQALAMCRSSLLEPPPGEGLTCLLYQRPGVLCPTTPTALLPPGVRIVAWEAALARAEPAPCLPVESSHPLYILYTSGTTAHPKGVLRPSGGHAAVLGWTMRTIYGMGSDEVWWAASDMGWVVGHSYSCYAPLINGNTSLMYEGKPDRTPDAGQYFRLIERHRVSALFTAPTALRIIKREDAGIVLGRKHNVNSLKYLFVAGEHCDSGTRLWAEKAFKVPVLNHWWQTETGHAITATAVGLGHSLKPPEFSTGMPFAGFDVRVLREDGSEADRGELGRIACKLPLPPGVMSTLYEANGRFKTTYFGKYEGFYDTMDAGYIDEDGYVYVTARDDDIINVAGHRLSTNAIEDVVMTHSCVVDAAVVGVPDPTKGQTPLCLYVMAPGNCSSEEGLNQELFQLVREMIGPIAAFNKAVAVQAIPRTRSGKIPRNSIAQLASSKLTKIPSTVEDPNVYFELATTLQRIGLANNAKLR